MEKMDLQLPRFEYVTKLRCHNRRENSHYCRRLGQVFLSPSRQEQSTTILNQASPHVNFLCHSEKFCFSQNKCKYSMTSFAISFDSLPHHKADSIDVGRTAKTSAIRRRIADYSATLNTSAPTSFPTDSPSNDSSTLIMANLLCNSTQCSVCNPNHTFTFSPFPSHLISSHLISFHNAQL